MEELTGQQDLHIRRRCDVLAQEVVGDAAADDQRVERLQGVDDLWILIFGL